MTGMTISPGGKSLGNVTAKPREKSPEELLRDAVISRVPGGNFIFGAPSREECAALGVAEAFDSWRAAVEEHVSTIRGPVREARRMVVAIERGLETGHVEDDWPSLDDAKVAKAQAESDAKALERKAHAAARDLAAAMLLAEASPEHAARQAAAALEAVALLERVAADVVAATETLHHACRANGIPSWREWTGSGLAATRLAQVVRDDIPSILRRTDVAALQEIASTAPKSRGGKA